MSHLPLNSAAAGSVFPLRTLFMLTSMPIGGAETLLVNLIRNLDRRVIDAEVCCLKQRGPLGEQLSREIPVHAELLRYKTDALVLRRLVQLMRRRQIDAVVTVGCGDKMFWGRLAAYLAGVPVIASALHSTGWPDGMGHLNRLLTPITDAFIAVAQSHGRHLVAGERLPADKVFVIPNGIDTQRFTPAAVDRTTLRQRLRLSQQSQLVTLVAALRPEKNHARFLRIAFATRKQRDNVEFLIVGDGPQRVELESLARSLNISRYVHFLGARHDIPDLLAASDVFLLTSDNEASPVSILEAMSCGLPVVASQVGSIDELIVDHETGFCVPVTDEHAYVARVIQLLSDDATRSRIGNEARQQAIKHGSLSTMVDGYAQLLTSLYTRKLQSAPTGAGQARARTASAVPPHLVSATK